MIWVLAPSYLTEQEMKQTAPLLGTSSDPSDVQSSTDNFCPAKVIMHCYDKHFYYCIKNFQEKELHLKLSHCLHFDSASP